MTDKKPKSFVLYADFEAALLKLSLKERGILFTMIFSYVNRGNIDEFSSTPPLVAMAFEIIRAQLDRDREKYEAKCAQNARNGKLGGRPKDETKPKESERFFEKPKKASGFSKNPKKPIMIIIIKIRIIMIIILILIMIVIISLKSGARLTRANSSRRRLSAPSENKKRKKNKFIFLIYAILWRFPKNCIFIYN